jgi:hypothetical protein
MFVQSELNKSLKILKIVLSDGMLYHVGRSGSDYDVSSEDGQ